MEQYRKEEAARQRVEEEQQARREHPAFLAQLCVAEALLIGQAIKCPGCKNPKRKDDACMHMDCDCGVHFCYACGADRYPGVVGTGAGYRPENKVSCGCDAASIYLQSQPGWSGFARGGESAAAGALMEFHRRRMAYFVGVVKRAIGPNVWGELREAFPDLLQDVLAGRSIQWDEVDAAEHPKFGTRAEPVLIQDEARQLQIFVRSALDTSHSRDEDAALARDHEGHRHDGGGNTIPVLPAAVPRHEQVVTSNIWLEQQIVLSETAPVVVKYQAMLTGSDSAIIGAFSLNRQSWEGGDCDALTWHAASDRDDFTFRHGMFEGFPPARRVAPFKLRLGQWHFIQVSLSLRAVEYSVDGRTFATLQNERRRGLVPHVDSGYWPSRGYIGMIHYAGDWKFRDLEIVTASTAA